MTAIDFIQYSERMVGEASPDYADTLNRALKTVVSVSGGDENAFVGFALRPAVGPTVGQFYRATDTDVGASWQTLTTAMISDLTSASTGITKVGTVNTGVWNATSIATTYTDAKVKTVTGTANRVTIGGTATDPTFDISAAYVGQTSIVTLGTVTTGTWHGTSIATGFTDAKVVSITGTASRLSVAGTATVPVLDIDAAYSGQTSIVTLGTVTTGSWTATSIATAYTDAKIKTVTGTVGAITISGTATDPIFTISAAYIGQNTITTLGTITTGVWNGTAIATANTIAQVIDVTGTANRIAIGGTATHPTVDIHTSYVGQNTITTVGTIGTGVWQGTSIATGFTDAKVKTVTGTSNRLSIGGTATDPTFDISATYVGQATITTLGTIATGTWAASTITVDKGGTNLTSFTIGDMVYASGATTLSKLAIGTAAQILVTNGGATAPAWHTLATADITDLTSAATGITKVGTVTTGVWNAGTINGIYGGTGVNNGSATITLGGSLTTSGAFALTLTVTAGTNVTLPTTGTLVNSAVTSLASLTSVGGAFAISGAFTGATTGAFSSTLSTSQLTITDTASRIIPGTTSFSVRNNANNADNLLISDAGAITVRSTIGGVTTISGTTATFTNLGGTLSTAAQGNITSVGTLTSLTTAGTVAINAVSAQTVLTSTTGTNQVDHVLISTGGTYHYGVENSAGSVFGATAYAQVIFAAASRNIEFFPGAAKALTLTAAGGAVFAGAGSGFTTLSGSGAVSGFTSAVFSGSLTAASWSVGGSDATAYVVGSTGTHISFGIVANTNAGATGVNAFLRFKGNSGLTSDGFFGIVQNAATYGDWVWNGNNLGAYIEQMRLTSAGSLTVTATSNSYGLTVTGTAAGSSTVSFVRTPSNTTDNIGVLDIEARSSGTAGVGHGPAITLFGQSNTTATQAQAVIGSVWTTATHATRTADLVFSVVQSAAIVEVGRFVGATKILSLAGGISATTGTLSASSASSTVLLVTNSSGTDPIAGQFSTGGSTTVGVIDVRDTDSGVATDVMMRFIRNGSVAGSITTTLALVTAYNTTSDKRLKIDRGVASDPSVLRSIVIHDIEWIADGSFDRGVFAQDAYAIPGINPHFIRVGTDDREGGKLVNPWGADYSKLIPDLIVGWQYHDGKFTVTDAALASLENRVAKLEAARV